MTASTKASTGQSRKTGSAPASDKARPTGPAPDEAINILLVDDDPDCRLLIRDAICESKVSNQVFEVGDTESALDFLHRRGLWQHAPRPGLIYLDVEMPGMNGIELLKQIKATPEMRDIPVVMMTGVSDERQMRLAAEAGANSYTIKPSNARQFLHTVLTSTNYWLTIHQYPYHHLPSELCRREPDNVAKVPTIEHGAGRARKS